MMQLYKIKENQNKCGKIHLTTRQVLRRLVLGRHQTRGLMLAMAMPYVLAYRAAVALMGTLPHSLTHFT